MKYLLLILISIIIFISCDTTNKVEFSPIGYISTNYNIQTGAPRQGVLVPKSKGILILDTVYQKSLFELNEFEYIWVLYYFDKVIGWDSIIIPPKSDHKFGIFATRSPRRPNPIGLSLVKIDTIINNKIYINDVDAFDGTPILDIKPFLPSVDFVKSKRNIDAEIHLGHHNENFITDSLVNEFILGK